MNRITIKPSVSPLTKNTWWKNDISKVVLVSLFVPRKSVTESCGLTSRSSDVIESWFLPVEISYLEHVWSAKFRYSYHVVVCQGMCRMTVLARWPVEVTSTFMIKILKFCLENLSCVYYVFPIVCGVILLDSILHVWKGIRFFFLVIVNKCTCLCGIYYVENQKQPLAT